jgi:hypothetical protein
MNKSLFNRLLILFSIGVSVSCSTDDNSNETPSSSSITSFSSSSYSSSSYSSSSLLSSSSQAVSYGVLNDDRDGETYRTIDTGTKTWMVDNLNHEIFDSYCYNNLESNCSKYGRLYTRADANTVCPSGWHLPNNAEIQEMITLVDAGNPNDYGFSANGLGGFINPEGYYQNVGIGYYWAYGSTGNHYQFIMYYLEIGGGYPTDYFFSVRCVKN